MQRMSVDRDGDNFRIAAHNLRRRVAERSPLPKVQAEIVMTGDQASAVDGILVEWADWSRGYRMRIGYPQKSAGFEPGGGVVTRESSDHQYDEVLNDRCRIVDQCIDDLDVPAQRAAIHRRYLSAVYRIRDYAQMLDDAHEALLVAFRRKGVLW